jgi:hypothetical protein
MIQTSTNEIQAEIIQTPSYSPVCENKSPGTISDDQSQDQKSSLM